MRRTALKTGMLVLMISADASADPVLDQSHVVTSFVSAAGVGNSLIDQYVAQTVRTGIAGKLVQIEFWANRVETGIGDLVFDIRTTDPDGSPAESDASIFAEIVLQRNSVPLLVGEPPDISQNLISLDLRPFNLFFNAGELFAFNFRNPGANENPGFGIMGKYLPFSTSGPYEQGQAFFRRSGQEFRPWASSSPEIGPIDLGFRTYVETIPEPSSAVYWCIALVGMLLRRHRFINDKYRVVRLTLGCRSSRRAAPWPQSRHTLRHRTLDQVGNAEIRKRPRHHSINY